MAYTSVSSNEIPSGTMYYSGKLSIGDYAFLLDFDDAGNCVVSAVLPGGRMASKYAQFPDSELVQWRVEANETAADVYAVVKVPVEDSTDEKSSTIPGVANIIPIACGSSGSFYWNDRLWPVTASPGDLLTIVCTDGQYGPYVIKASATQNDGLNQLYDYDGRRVWFATHGYVGYGHGASPGITHGLQGATNGEVAWTIIYGTGKPTEYTTETKLIARFAINLGDAGGYPGGGGGWTQPGDWNPVPTTTLHLTVNGALSGRHNDPMNDPSYSYLPADNTAQAGYGCGGDGGHGGGGGGGASTIIVRQFATNKANSKDILALARRHGYGSGGGKGGKGGDGCILIYY